MAILIHSLKFKTYSMLFFIFYLLVVNSYKLIVLDDLNGKVRCMTEKRWCYGWVWCEKCKWSWENTARYVKKYNDVFGK